MDIYFVTGNRHKVQEAELALKCSNIRIHLLDAEKQEPDKWTLEDVARNNAKRIADETGKTVIIEDTGVFFEAFDNFPGNKPKRYFEQLGYAGLMKKLEHKADRSAYFKTVIGYCEPGKEPDLFIGILKGTIATEVKGLEEDVMPYERIFVCKDGRYLYQYSRKEKNTMSHRAQAFRKLKEYLMTK